MVKVIDKEVRKELRKEIEIKQLTFAVSPGAALASQQASAATVNYVTPAIAQGSGQGQRVGNRIMLHDIELRGYVKAGAAAEQDCRMILFRDMQCNGAVPVAAEVLSEIAASTGCNADYNQDYRHRFKILYDKRFALHVVGGATDVAQQVMFQWKKRYPIDKGAALLYNSSAATGAIGTTQGGQLFALFLTSLGAATPFFWFDLVIKYEDA